MSHRTRNRREAYSLQLRLSNEARAFVKNLAGSGIWLLAIGLRGAEAIPESAVQGRYDDIGARAIDVSQIGANDSLIPFSYPRGQRHVLPFFTSQERAMLYRDDNGLGADLSVFQTYASHAGFVSMRENDNFDLLLNPRTPEERELTQDERLFLRAICSIG